MVAATAGTSCLRSTPLAVRVLFPPPAQPANEAARRSTADFAASAARSRIPDDGRLSGRFTHAHYPGTGRPARVALAAYAFPHAGLSDDELDALVEEATVDAYGDEEQLGGFAVMIEDNLEVPFETTVLGARRYSVILVQVASGIYSRSS